MVVDIDICDLFGFFFCYQVILLCCLWYSISSTNNVIGKVVLTNLPFPLTVTIVHLGSIALYSGPVLALSGVRPQLEMEWSTWCKCILPLVLGKFFTSVTSHVSLWKVPVSYAHTGWHAAEWFIINFIHIICSLHISYHNSCSHHITSHSHRCSESDDAVVHGDSVQTHPGSIANVAGLPVIGADYSRRHHRDRDGNFIRYARPGRCPELDDCVRFTEYLHEKGV